MSRSSQRKGANGERELTEILKGEGFPVVRGESQSYGMVPDISGLPGVHVECKRVEKLNIETAMEQAERDAERFKDGSPAVFHRRNRCRWLVTMRLDGWLRLYKKGVEHDG